MGHPPDSALPHLPSEGRCGAPSAAARQTALDFGAQEFVALDKDVLEDVGQVDLVFDVLGGDIAKRSAGVICAEERW